MKPVLAMLGALAALAVLAAACSGGESAGSDGGAPGAVCGGRGTAPCATDEFCDFGNNLCGASDATGRCVKRPANCPALLIPEFTCGCDQMVYSSPCEVMLAGTDLNEAGTCDLDPGEFACGYRQCNGTREFCLRQDSAGAGNEFSCRGLPASCTGAASCGCLAGEPCGDRCAGDAASGLTLTCRP